MNRPVKSSLDMVLEGVFSSEVVDSSGEIVKLEGMDITTLEAGEGVANYEHTGKEGGGKEKVGKIIYVKKIFKDSDCEDESQRFFFEQVRKKPYLYGQVRLFDGAGHAEAQRLAAQIRDFTAHEEPVLVRFSIEGSTLTKDGNIIKECLARQVAMTFTPANKVCNSRLVQDPNAPDGFKLKKAMLEDPTLAPIGETISIQYNPILGTERLAKALSVSYGDVAPSSLTGGAALQREDLSKTYSNTVLAAMRDYDGFWDKEKFKDHLKKTFKKAALPDVSDAFLDHFTQIADDWKVGKVKKSEPATFVQLESQAIDLMKSVRSIVENTPQVDLPKVYKIGVKRGNETGPLGRIMIFNDTITHLEDYRGIMAGILPEGPVTEATPIILGSLLTNPGFQIQEHVVENEPNGETKPQVATAQEDPLPPRPAVFEYQRIGMSHPHTIEFSPNGAAIDGVALDPRDLSLILENASNGTGTIKWLNPPAPLAKKEAEEMDPDIALQHIRAAVKSGALHPSVERSLTKHLYEDPMVEGVGNKYAASRFLAKNKPGVYGSLDMNNFKTINDKYGHQAGDEAIKAVGGAFQKAGQKVGNVKVFRAGGDEFSVWSPDHESMSNFLRHATTHVEALPPVGGQHKQSFSVGLGHTFGVADQALLLAKKQKNDSVTGQPLFKPGKTPNLGHSLYQGSEGPLFQPKPPSLSPPVGNKLP